MFLILALSIPFYPLLGILRMTTGPVGWLDMYGGPSFGGVILVMALYAIIFYLLGCLTAYIRNKRPQSGMNRDLRATINQNSKLIIVIVLFLFALAGIIIAFTCYKAPLISTHTPDLKTPTDTGPDLKTPVAPNDTQPTASKIFKCDKQNE